MNLTKSIVYGLLVLLVIAGVGAAVWTVIPDPSISKVSDLGKAWGYTTHCSWAPYSTIICIAIALIALVIFLIARRLWR
jgi:uncharacterized membrane protein